jgi:hypothetical protein
MGRLRRFVLVATTVCGGIFWLSLPLHAPHADLYPLIGLVAAIASAAVSWTPRLVERRTSRRWRSLFRIIRILLAGWVAFGLLGFAALAWHDLGTFGVAMSSLWIAIVAWLVATGVVAQLVIANVRPSDIYLGYALVFVLATPFMATHKAAAAALGQLVLGLGPLICAKITHAIQRRAKRAPHDELPGARLV